MVLKNLFIAIICAALLAWCGGSIADEYRPGQLLGLDLSKAVLSPRPLGPAAHFAPVALEARADRAGEAARAEPITHSKLQLSQVRSAPRHGLAPNRLARHHGNPLDAQAFDTRIQVWPCKSGGICRWQRYYN